MNALKQRSTSPICTPLDVLEQMAPVHSAGQAVEGSLRMANSCRQ